LVPSGTSVVVPDHENTPVILLYPIGPVAESEEREIFVARIPERLAIFVFAARSPPERVMISAIF
jgi:hypothetical protein